MYIKDAHADLWVDHTNPGAGRAAAQYVRSRKRTDTLHAMLWWVIGILAADGIGIAAWLWYVGKPKHAAAAIALYLVWVARSDAMAAERLRILRACRVSGVVMDCNATAYRYLVQALEEIGFSVNLDAYPDQVTNVFITYALACHKAEMAIANRSQNSQAEAMEVWAKAQDTARQMYYMFFRQ